MVRLIRRGRQIEVAAGLGRTVSRAFVAMGYGADSRWGVSSEWRHATRNTHKKMGLGWPVVGRVANCR